MLRLLSLFLRRALITCFLVFIGSVVFGKEPTLIINSTTRHTYLDPYVNVLHTERAIDNIEEVLRKSKKNWLPLSGLSTGYNKSVGWFKLSFKTSVSVDQLILYLPLISKAEAFIVQDKKIKGSFKGGEFVKTSNKTIISNRTSFVIPLYLTESGSFEIYIYAENIKEESIDFNWHLEPYSDWIWDYYYATIKDAIFHSVNLVLIISALLLFVFLRKNNYLYYASYLISISIYLLWDAGYTANYLIGGWPKVNFTLKSFQNFAPIFYILFLFNFQPNQKIKSNCRSIYLFVIAINLIFIIIEVSWILFFERFTFVLVHSANAISLASILLISTLFLINFKIKDKQSFLISVGVFTMVCSFGATLLLFYLGKENFIIAFQLGLSLEIFLFTLSLIFQFRKNEKHKLVVQNNLIKQLKKNKILQENYNQELEDKVTERTKEIERKNEEITKQRNELLNNSAELEELNIELMTQSETIYAANERLYKNEKILRKAYQKLKTTKQELDSKNVAIQKINKNQEKIIASRNRGIIKAKAELDEFLYRTSHNLKGPVARVKGLQELLKIELIDNQSTEEYLIRLGRVIEKMEGVFQKLNAVSIINKTGSVEKPTDLSKLIAEVVANQTDLIANQKAEVIEDTQPVVLQVNPKIIRIIVKYILENSLQFIHRERAPKIEIHLSKQKNKFIKLSIKDNGVGIKAENIKRIFDMFYIGSLNSEGDGLGLYIVKKAVDSLNGFINVESAFREGTTVSILLPVSNTKNEVEKSKKNQLLFPQ